MPLSDTRLQILIDRSIDDPAARAVLLDHACDRLLKLTRKMFHTYPSLRRWEQTDDVLQNAMLRLHRALSEVSPQSVRHFFNLAAVTIRRTLLDLSKHHLGPHGQGTKHDTDPEPQRRAGSHPDAADQPGDAEGWTLFHTGVETLPDEEKEVVGLLFYEGLSQQEAAEILGVSLRTLKRRWLSARCLLRETLNHPEGGE